ncbi:MAG: ccoN, partial [Cellvibrio sp.]|nr:ccoN [Cellvibrio sp.]
HMLPKLYDREEMHSVKLINLHFWLATVGTVLYVVAMWINGIGQGLMWRAFNPDGSLTYSFIETVVFSKGGYVMRAIGGAFFLTGMLIMAYNTYRTVSAAKQAAESANQPVQAPAV